MTEASAVRLSPCLRKRRHCSGNAGHSAEEQPLLAELESLLPATRNNSSKTNQTTPAWLLTNVPQGRVESNQENQKKDASLFVSSKSLETTEMSQERSGGVANRNRGDHLNQGFCSFFFLSDT